MLVSDVITSALSRIGVIPIGGAIPAEWTTIAIVELNRMLQHWAAINLLPTAVAKSTHTLTAGTAIYLVGTAEAISLTRPTSIIAASITLNSVETPCEVLRGLVGYAIVSKDARGRPSQLFYDPGVGKGTAILAPVPDGAYSLALWSVAALTAVTVVGDTVPVPVEFEHVVTTMFAAHIMTMWGKTDTFLAQEAIDAFSAVQTSANKGLAMRQGA